MSDAVSSLRPSSAVLWAILAAGVSMWVSFAVVASATRTPARPAPPARARPKAAPAAVALSDAPALRVRAGLLERAPAEPAAAPVLPMQAAARAPAQPAPAAAPAAAASDPATAPATPETASAVKPAPAPRPAAKPQRTLTAEPKHSAAPDFDESAPAGFDSSG